MGMTVLFHTATFRNKLANICKDEQLLAQKSFQQILSIITDYKSLLIPVVIPLIYQPYLLLMLVQI